jgi:uncharacterized protein YdaU (DUF1376 family)
MSLAYFPLYPDDFEADTAHLTLCEDGAFNRLLRLCWRTPGCSVPSDRAWVYRRLRANTEADQTVVETVIAEFFVTENGRLSNARLTKEWLAANEAHKRRKSAGAKGGKAKALKTNETEPSNATTKLKQPEPEPEPLDTIAKAIDVPAAPKVENVDYVRADRAFQLFVQAATRQPCWSVPEAMNKTRRASLTARLREAGLGGWERAIHRAEQSPFLTGRSGDKPFALSLDWMLKPANFTKIVEGNYDDRTHHARGASGHAASNGGRPDAFDRLADRLQGGAAGSDPRQHDDAGAADSYVIEAGPARIAG